MVDVVVWFYKRLSFMYMGSQGILRRNPLQNRQATA
jgi:hypothetical protein